MLETPKRRTDEDRDRFTRRLPVLDPAINVRARDCRPSLHSERGNMPFEVADQAEVPLDKGCEARSPAERFQPDDAGAGEDIEEAPLGHGVAEDAEKGFTDHLRRG